MPIFKRANAIFVAFLFLTAALLQAQSGGNSTSVTGIVSDPSGAVVPDATVEIHNPVSGLDRKTTTDSAGKVQHRQCSLQPLSLVSQRRGLRSL